MYDYLIHHGIKGQRWGIRRYQNYDGTRIKDPYMGDISYNKDHKFERLYKVYDKKNKDKYLDKRLYVSNNANDYDNDYFLELIEDPNKARVSIYKTNKKIYLAGKDSINKILKEIGEKPIHTTYDEDYDENNQTNTDFLYKNKELGEKFIKTALSKGFDGVRDPVDDLDGWNDERYSSTILFNKKIIDLEKDIPLNEYRKTR